MGRLSPTNQAQTTTGGRLGTVSTGGVNKYLQDYQKQQKIEQINSTLKNINSTPQQQYNALSEARKLGLIDKTKQISLIKSISEAQRGATNKQLIDLNREAELTKYGPVSYLKTLGTGMANVIGEATGQNAAIRNAQQQTFNNISKTQLALVNALNKTTDAAKKRQLQQSINNLETQKQSAYSDIQNTQNQMIYEGDPLRIAASAGEAALDIATAGTLTGLKQGAKQLLKQPVGRIASTALPQALSGALSPLEYYGKNATPEQIAAGAAVSGALGGALGAAPFAKQLVQKDIAKQTQKVAQVSSLEDALIEGAKATKNKYNKGIIDKISTKLREIVDPATELRKIDKNMNWKSGDSIEAAFDESLNYRNKVKLNIEQDRSTGMSVAKVFQNHADDAEQFNVYRNAVRDLSERALKKKPLQPELTTKQLNGIVKRYEAARPLARQEIRTINEAVNDALAFAKKNGVIDETLESKLTRNSFYTPVKRVQPEFQKQQISAGRNVGSIAQQKVVQELRGGEGPLDITFDAIQEYIDRSYKQGSQAKVASKVLEAQKAGAIEGSKLVVEAGNKAMRKQITGEIKSAKKDIIKIGKKLSITNKEASKLATVIRNLQKKGRGELSKELKKFATDYETKLGDKVDAVIHPETLKNQLLTLDNKEIRKLQKMIANREPKLATKLNEIMDLNRQLLEQKASRAKLKETKFDFSDDSATGLSTISGLENGQKFTLELPPEITKVIKGVDVKEQGRIVKLLQGVVKGIKVFWTGPLNPLFAVKNILYDVSANINALVDNPAAFAKSLKPGSIKEMFKSVSSSNDFQKAIRYRGASIPGGSQLPTEVATSVQSIMSKRSPLARAKYVVRHPKELLEVSDMFTGKIGGMTRTRIAQGYYKNALAKGMNQEDALKEAVYAYNNMAPNFQRTSELAKSANLISPYFSASIAGTRAMLRPIMKNPKTALGVYGAITASFAVSTAHNLSTEVGQQFYKDMQDSDSQSVLDNNYIIVLPTAYKDEKTGEWKGIIKIPLSPEYRSLNGLARKETQQVISNEGGADPLEFAGKLFDFSTGGVANISNPLVDTTKILYGVKARSSITKPEQLVQGYMANLPKSEQKYDFTSDTAKMLSSITGSNISPIQADALLRQLGFAGGVATGRGSAEQFKGAFTGAYAKTSQKRFYDAYDPLYSKRQQISRQIKSGSDKDASKKIDQFNSELEKAVSKYKDSYKSDSELLERLNKIKITDKRKFIYNAKK